MSDSTTAMVDVEKRRRGIRNTVVILLLVVVALLGLIVHRVMTPRTLTPAELRAFNVIEFDTPRQFSDFALLDQNGETFSKAQLQGKWSLIYFGFTHCPDLCPTTLLQLSHLLPQLPDAAAKKTQVILVTLDPARDTPQVLAPYISAFDKDFIAVTGDFLSIRKFANEVNVAFAKVMQGDDYTIDHSSNVVIINPRGDYQGFIKPPFDSDKLTLALPSVYREFPHD